MIDKGKISSISENGEKAVVIPSYTDSAVTFPLVIPDSLKDSLSVNDSVLYATFEDNTGIILSRMDGQDGGKVEPITYSLRTMAMSEPEPCVEIVLNCDKGNSSKACLVGDGGTSVTYDEDAGKIRISSKKPTEGQDKHFTHTQSVAAEVWEITHNLGKIPSITVVDSAGTEVIGEYKHISENEVKLTFNGAFSGKAYLN